MSRERGLPINPKLLCSDISQLLIDFRKLRDRSTSLLEGANRSAPCFEVPRRTTSEADNNDARPARVDATVFGLWDIIASSDQRCQSAAPDTRCISKTLRPEVIPGAPVSCTADPTPRMRDEESDGVLNPLGANRLFANKQ